MESTLFTALTATEEATLSGGKKKDYHKPEKKDDKKKKYGDLVKLNLNVINVTQTNVSVGDVEELTQNNVAIIGASAGA